MELLLAGDVETGQSLMRNYIKPTVGFPELAERTRTPKNSLMRMFSPKGNPPSRNMFGVIAELAKAEGVNLSLRAKRSARYGRGSNPLGLENKDQPEPKF